MAKQNTTYRFIGKVLSDGHLSIPAEAARTVGEEFEVLLTPLDDIKALVSAYLGNRLEKQGLIKDITLDLPETMEAIRTAFGTGDISVIMESVRR